MMLVTLPEAKYQLMMDHDQDDPYIERVRQGDIIVPERGRKRF